MWHKNLRNERCHAWDIDVDAFNLWKQGGTALKASMVFLPSGVHPAPGTRVVCGTCSSTDINPTIMEKELIVVSADK